MSSTNTIYSCPCLNIRVTTIPQQHDSMEIHVMHHRLVDFLVAEGGISKRFLVCLLCRTLVQFRQLFFPRHQFTTIKFNDVPFESVILPVNRNEPCSNILTQLEFLKALNSPSYSSAFHVLNEIPPDTETNLNSSALKALCLDIYPAQLADAVSSLCDVAIRHNQRLRHEILLTRHTTIDNVDLVGNQIRTRSDFRMLCRRLWDYQQTDPVDPVQGNDFFEAFIGNYLVRIDNAFSEMHETSRRDSITSVDSIEAITFEGISNRYRRFSSPAVFSGRGFGDLPTETAWKIFRYLEPVYLSGDLIAVQNYLKEVSMFAQLSLVSKSWLDLTNPSLYYRVVLLSDPVRLDKLLRALKVHGPSVRVVVIDDIDIGPLHIRTCSRYIDQCFSLCPSVHHIECNGDIGLDTSRMQTLPSLALVLPRWLPVDIPAAFRFAGPELKRFSISEWNMLWEDENAVQILSTLPQLEAFSIADSELHPELLSKFLHSITSEGKNVLRELSFTGNSTLKGPNILQLLKINTLSAHITVLRIRPSRVTIHVDDDNSIQNILRICPCLVEFSYTFPSSSEIFTDLPQTLRTLELAVISSYTLSHSKISEKLAPRITTVDPFVQYLRSSASKNIRRLSIIRPVLQWDKTTGKLWRRLGVQTFDRDGELQGVCKERNLELSCSFISSG